VVARQKQSAQNERQLNPQEPIMPVTVADILALTQKIAADRKKLEEQEHALAVVAQMLRDNNAAASPQLDLPEPARSGITFTEAVRQSVNTYRDTEFTVANIESSLKASGVRLKEHPRARIAMILHDLTKKNVITRTQKGSGNTPHRYRLRPGANGSHQAA
jgi:hypothetical protein